MQIVIDIPEGAYEEICRAKFPIQDGYRLVSWIKDGTPLPKEHGDLKDFNNLKRAFIMWNMVVQGNFSNADIASIIYNSPTIIEADKKEE